MIVRRTLLGVTAALGVLVLAAAPALAHEEINPKTVETGKPTFFTLTAANEAKTNLTKVVLTAPKGVAFGETTRSPSGWTVDAGPTTITWSGGKVAPATFEEFGFEIDGAGQPGTLSFGVALTAGDTENVTVPVVVVAAGTTTPTASTPSTAAGSTTTIATAPVPPATVPASVNKSIDRAKSRATTAEILGAIGIAVGVVAVIVSLARGRRHPGATGAAQDF